MLLKVKDTSVMFREGGTPSGSNLGSSSVMVTPRPTGPRSLTVTPIGSSQHLRCCETEVMLHDAESLKTYLKPTSLEVSADSVRYAVCAGFQFANFALLRWDGDVRCPFDLAVRRCH